MTLAEASENVYEAQAFRTDDYAQLRLDLVRAVRPICPSWLASRSEDIVQTALIRVSTLLEKSPDPRAFSSSYLRKAAYSALVDEIRARRRRQEVTFLGCWCGVGEGKSRLRSFLVPRKGGGTDAGRRTG